MELDASPDRSTTAAIGRSLFLSGNDDLNSLHTLGHSAPDRGTEYCDESVSVCLCVCLSVRDHIFGIKRPIFIKFFVHVTYGRGSVLLWWRRDTLCTSGFMEYVIFAYKPRLLDVTAQL